MLTSIIANNNTKHNDKTVYGKFRAEELSLRSRSAWKAMGVVIPKDATPAGVVLYDRAKVDKVRADEVHSWQIVVRTEGKYAHVANRGGCYDVFPREAGTVKTPKQTTNNKQKKEEEQSSSSFLLPPSFPLSSLVRQHDAESDVNPYKTRPLRRKKVSNLPDGANSAKPDRNWAFAPEGLTPEDKVKLGDDLELAYVVCDRLHLYSTIGKKGNDSWVDLSKVYMETLFGNQKNWHRVKDKMLSSKIMERITIDRREDDYELGIEWTEERGVMGKKCYGYRLREDLRRSTHRRTTLSNKQALRSIKPLRGWACKWLEAHLHQITVAPVDEAMLNAIASNDDDEGDIKKKVDAYSKSIDRVRHGCWRLEPDGFSGRLHSLLTNLKRELRAYLRVSGQALHQLDIKGSQLLFIAYAAKQAGYEDDGCLAACQRDIYQEIADDLGTTRAEVKKRLTQRALFASNRSKYQHSAVVRHFARKFPETMKFITKMKSGKKTKANPKPHNRLAKLAQQMEVKYIVKVCDRIRKETPDCFVATIHDCLMMLPEDSDYVKSVMREEFERMGLSPRLEIAPCD